MGWTYCDSWTRRAAMDEAAPAEYSGKGPRGTFTAWRQGRKCVGNVVYTLHAVRHADGSGETFLRVTLLQKSGRAWGYKSMTHYEGPYVCACPEAWLDVLDVRNAYAADFVARARAWHAGRKGEACPEAARRYANDSGPRRLGESDPTLRDLASAWRDGRVKYLQRYWRAAYKRADAEAMTAAAMEIRRSHGARVEGGAPCAACGA